MKIYFCVANNPDGIEITPRSLFRIRQGKYWVPDCADYQTKFNLPRRLKAKEIFAGWSCYNCKFLKEKEASPKKEIPTPKKIQKPAPKAKETLTRQMLSEKVSNILDISQRQADTIITQSFAIIAERLSDHDKVSLKDFGTFEARPRKGWKGRHPTTGEQIQISDGFTIRFRSSKKMKETIANWPGKSEESA
jgi:nucleoid DNA-binding protein